MGIAELKFSALLYGIHFAISVATAAVVPLSPNAPLAP